ncbi:transmembrane protein [Tieghemostelium lacteum]|uniref:Transmembrane protein n=1 Tax=Tieghemostelium lacteum TaxID=361077 RepID=A0A151ZCZ8_TIELA|nr:transmembrane protein [Tieghemostelium lacteum]|eukprot:KYQ91832.1 transmembrane protein [Tieghemostelium lacteum]
MFQYFNILSKRLVHRIFLFLDKNYYFRLHLLYFVIVGFLGGCILKGCQSEAKFIDTLYISFSSLTGTGLSSVDIAKWNTLSLVIVMLLVQLGSIVTLTLPIIIIRRYYLKRLIDHVSKKKHLVGHRDETGQIIVDDEEYDYDENFNFIIDENNQEYHIDLKPQFILEDDSVNEKSPTSASSMNTHLTNTSSNNIIDSNNVLQNNNNTPQQQQQQQILSPKSGQSGESSSQNAIVDIKESDHISEKRINIKGHVDIEYRALGKLVKIISIYQLVSYMIGFLVLGIYISTNKYTKKIMKHNGVSTWWFALFETLSAFNNAGFSLFSDNVVQLNQYPFILLVLCILVVLGNTLFPVVLRSLLKICKRFSTDKEPFEYLLGNSRSMFTHLFPEKDTMILFFIWCTFNLAQISLMAILEINENAFLGMSSYIKFINYLFQSINTRSSGFNSVDISKLSDSVLVLMMGLMFVSSYPFIVQMRKTTVNGKYNNQSEVMKDIIVKDLLTPYLAILIISIFEESSLEHIKEFTVFYVIFEVISAFGNVGYSVGFPGTFTSLSSQFGVVSKLTLIVIMLLGKHRTLPDSVDKSVSLNEFRPVSKIYKKIQRGT